jgi:hypothetical protein
MVMREIAKIAAKRAGEASLLFFATLFASRRAFRRRIHSVLTLFPAAHASEKRLVKLAPVKGSKHVASSIVRRSPMPQR